MSNVNSIYQEVRTYFPDWDPAGRWRVEIKDQLSGGYLGNSYCNRRAKTIEIYELFTADDDNIWCCLLIRNICLAIANTRHGSKWTTVLLEVASRAETIGQKSLADLIRADVQSSENCAEPNLAPILLNIEFLISENPDEATEIIIDEAANMMGISGSELLKRQPLVTVFCEDMKRMALQKNE
jgi:hypothetical protein